MKNKIKHWKSYENLALETLQKNFFLFIFDLAMSLKFLDIVA